jgi:hypothetical protein
MSIRLRLNRGTWINAPYREIRRRRIRLKWQVCRQCGHGSWFQVDGYQVCRDCVAHIDRAIVERERLYREHVRSE